MLRVAVLVLVLAVVSVFRLPPVATAVHYKSPMQACPTYLTSLQVDLVNSSPVHATVGDVVTTLFHVIYPDGSPVVLDPQVASFLWVGPAGSIRFDIVPVTKTGNPGLYNYTQSITGQIAEATLGPGGVGEMTIYVVGCRCSDSQGNRGPTGNVDSDDTLTPSDNSHLDIGPQVTPQQPIVYVVPLTIALLILVAVLLFFLRSRRKKKRLYQTHSFARMPVDRYGTPFMTSE